MRQAAAFVLGAAFVSAAAGSASADGNARTGALLARHWCGSCHGLGVGVASDAAPPLESIAARPDRERWITAWLADPHPPMPNFNLSRSEIDDIVAYLKSLSER
jgi:mono/diheme cytochrome c family protein